MGDSGDPKTRKRGTETGKPATSQKATRRPVSGHGTDPTEPSAQVSPRLQELLADAGAAQRLLNAPDEIHNVRGLVVEEVLHREIEQRIRTRTGLDALLPEHIDPRTATVVTVRSLDELQDGQIAYIPGRRIRDLGGHDLGDGMLIRRTGRSLEIVTILESKAGQRRAQELHVTERPRSRDVRAADRDELERVRRETAAENRQIRDKSRPPARVIQQERGGQIVRDFERLFPNADAQRTRVQHIVIDGHRTPVTISRRTTRFVLVAPRDVRIQISAVRLREQGFQVETLALDIEQKEVERAAREVQSKIRRRKQTRGTAARTDTAKQKTATPARKKTTPLGRSGRRGAATLGATLTGVVASLAAAAAVAIFTQRLRTDIADQLANIPQPRKNADEVLRFFASPKTQRASTILDLLHMNVQPASELLREHHQRIIELVNEEMQVLLGDSRPNSEKLEVIEEQTQELQTYEDLLMTLTHNLENALQQEETALESAQAAEELRELFENTVAVGMILTSAPIHPNDLNQARNNLTGWALRIRITFVDLRHFHQTVLRLLTEEQELSAWVNQIYWRLMREQMAATIQQHAQDAP